MIKIQKIIVLIYLFLSTPAFSQHKELDCVKGNYFHDYIVDLSGDTTFLEPIEFYFPVQDYLDINSDCFEAYQLSYYSKIEF